MVTSILQWMIVITATVMSATEAGECTLGDIVEPTIPFIAGGQYVNLDSPATCSGNLTAWHYCYYRSSIDSTSTTYSLWFRVWRKNGGNTYDLVSNYTVAGSPNRAAGNVVCEDVLLAENEFTAVEEGDVIAVYIPFSLDTVSVLPFRPTTGRVHHDTRGSSAFLENQFQRNEDLNRDIALGMHLYADISFDDPPTMATTEVNTDSPTEATPPGNTEEQVNTNVIGQTNEPTDLNNNSGSSGNDIGAAVAAVIVLLLVLGVAIGITVFFVCYAKRKHGSIKGCLKSSGSRFSAIDNLIYRVGSDRIPIHLPKKKTRSTTVDSQPYDIPRDRHERRLYDIPRNSSSIEASLDYSGVRPLSQSISTVQSTDYIIPRSPSNSAQSQQAGSEQNGHACTKNEQEYIYMDDCEEGREASSKANGNGDTEAYIYLSYGTVAYHKLLNQATKEEDEEKKHPFYSPPSNEEEIYVVLSEQQIKVIPRKSVQTKERLGSGQFGNVDKGIWKGTKGTLDVAVKSLTQEAKQKDKVRFLQEAAIMGQFKHPNITHLHGIVTQGEPLLLILEYMPKGDLKHYLTALRPEPNTLLPGRVQKLLVSFSQQVALGMHYLASKGFVHRDLAARNIFVSAEDTCKIGDFGMSRDLAENGCYLGHGGKVPLKWTAPEAIHLKKYSTASDVWSYGCLLYEIWSLGRKPFRGMDGSKALQLVDGGYRLPPPPGCPLVVYDLMIKCWHPVAAARPKYRDILTILLQDERKLLDIPVEDASTHSEACLLGASMEAGKRMYIPLQHCYNPDATDRDDPDYEYGETDNEDL